MAASKSPHIPYLSSPLLQRKPKTLILNCQSSNFRPQFPNRRLLLFSLPLSGFLLLPNQFESGSSSSYAATQYDPVTPMEKDASDLLSQRVSEAVELLEKGRELQAQGDFNGALGYFSQVVENYKDFAFSDYARVGRALALYEVGDREEAIAEMEDVSISLKGYPEVHAALAAALYADKHAPLLAENQFTIATLLDPHFTDLSYVRDSKHWPPSLISSLRHFITLS
ncbi:tetratricopeptide repeat protein [Senna tora]|uniref:Tetratricopeptide repeat protein n=1 Tax=Senna tora TaxID=362788 RepID=A0A835CES3_9FABA|nr:tetratricopeptide repeat protein [Senna tora]